MSPCIFPLVGGIAIIGLQIVMFIHPNKDEYIKDQEFKYFWQRFFFLIEDSLEGANRFIKPILILFWSILYFAPTLFAVMQCIFCKVFKKINA